MPQDSVGAEDFENFEGSTGRRDCYMPQASVGAEDYDSFEKRTGCRECYMPKVSIGGEYFNSCGDSTGRTDCENSKGFMDCRSFKISIGDEESFSCKNNDTDSKHCKDGKKGGYLNTKEGYRSREDYSVFEDCDRGKITWKSAPTIGQNCKLYDVNNRYKIRQVYFILWWECRGTLRINYLTCIRLLMYCLVTLMI